MQPENVLLQASFDNFVDLNNCLPLLIDFLCKPGGHCHLHGSPYSGKSHIFLACINFLSKNNISWCILKEVDFLNNEIIDDDTIECFLIEDLENFSYLAQGSFLSWLDIAIANKYKIITSSARLDNIVILPDLLSRLSAAILFYLPLPKSDNDWVLILISLFKRYQIVVDNDIILSVLSIASYDVVKIFSLIHSISNQSKKLNKRRIKEIFKLIN